MAKEEKDSSDSSDQEKYFKSLIKSGHTGKFVESGTDEPFVDTPEDTDETSEVSDEIKSKALVLLGLVEEYFVRPETEGVELNELNELANEDDLAVLLSKLEKGYEVSEEDETMNVKDSIKQQIQLLLGIKGVKEYFFGLLKQEAVYFQTAKPTLKRVAILQRLKERITSGVTKFYIRDKRSKGKLMATTAKAIKSLEGKKEEADREERKLNSNADTQTQSWLKVQELLEYKKQLRETGFAKTESRKQLTERVLLDVAHDNKVFLVGSTGTGKTQLAMLVADLVNEEGFEIVSWHEGTTPRDLFGYREVSQDEQGIKSGTKKGPTAIAITEGRIVIHDEYTAGSTRAQLSAKAQMNAKVGQQTRIPGFNGEVFTVEEGYGEIFTGNPKDERTKEREDMDPAILRMLSGIKVPYMPADELFKIILAELIDDTGLLPLSRHDVELIRRLTQASELMQMCHDREIDKLKGSEYSDSIAQIFGNNIEEVHLDKSFLDTGTLMRLFKGWDLERARGRKFHTFLNTQLKHFIEDPKFDMDKEERKLAKTILEALGILWRAVAGPDPKESFEPYILPSKIGDLFNEVIDEDVFDDEDEDDLNLDGKLEEIINDQYSSALGLLRGSGLLDNESHPSIAKVKQLLNNISRDQLETINQMQNPVLQLVPTRTCSEYETALNQNKPMVNSKGEAQQDAYTSDWVKKAFDRADTRDNAQAGKISGWKVVITEGADVPALLPGDDTNKELEDRLEWFRANYKNKGISGIDIKSYMLLQMAGFAKTPPCPVDDIQGSDETWTMLNEEEIHESLVAGANWNVNVRRVDLYESHTDLRDYGARFRASVVVDMEESNTLENIVETQYESAVSLLRTSGLLTGTGHPSKRKVKELLKRSISPDQLETINQMDNPVLQLVPTRTCSEYETALNQNKPMVNSKGKSQQDAHTSDWMKKAFDRADTRDNAQAGKISGWKVVITEGADAPALLPGDDTNKKLQDRLEWFRANYKNKGISGIDIKSYMLLQMAGFAKTSPCPIDDVDGSDNTWTMLNEEEVHGGLVAGASWIDNRRQVFLSGGGADVQSGNARFRASVVVDMPKS